jgi:hypothetical protein
MHRWVGVLALVALAGCGERVTVTGIVRDNFGAPVEGAQVTVDGRDVAATAADGTFRFDYAPGRVPFLVEGEGYVPAEYSLAIARAEEPPLEVVVQRLPPEPGLWAVGAEDYVPLRNCSQVGQTVNAADVRYLIDKGVPAELVPGEDGTVTFVDTGEPVGGQGTRMARVGTNRLFYRTERTISTIDTVFTDTVFTNPIEPEFRSAGNWFTARLPEGTFVQYDRVGLPPYNNIVPNAAGRCYLFRVGPVAEPWLPEEITDEQLAALGQQLKACWPAPPEGTQDQVVTVHLALNADGTLSEPATVARSPLDTVRGGVAFVAAQQAAVAAAQQCQPYRMFPGETYEAWRDLTVTLRTADLFGP